MTNTNGGAHSNALSVAERTLSSKMSAINSRIVAKQNGGNHSMPSSALNQQHPTESAAIFLGKYGGTSYSGPDADIKISQLGDGVGKWILGIVATSAIATAFTLLVKSKCKIDEKTVQTVEHVKQEGATTVELGKREEKKTEELEIYWRGWGRQVLSRNPCVQTHDSFGR